MPSSEKSRSNWPLAGPLIQNSCGGPITRINPQGKHFGKFSVDPIRLGPYVKIRSAGSRVNR